MRAYRKMVLQSGSRKITAGPLSCRNAPRFLTLTSKNLILNEWIARRDGKGSNLFPGCGGVNVELTITTRSSHRADLRVRLPSDWSHSILYKWMIREISRCAR